MQKKLNLDELEVESFVTLEKFHSCYLFGGADGDLTGSGEDISRKKNVETDC